MGKNRRRPVLTVGDKQNLVKVRSQGDLGNENGKRAIERPIPTQRETDSLTVPTTKEFPMTRRRWAVVISAGLASAPAMISAAPPAPVVACSSGSCQPAATSVGCSEGRYPYDAPDPWLHGYFQETAAYAGFHAFRPYNYKHVFAQSQIAAEWGASRTAPYSHQLGGANSQAK
jgi:hypothetical protein